MNIKRTKKTYAPTNYSYNKANLKWYKALKAGYPINVVIDQIQSGSKEI